MKRLAFLEYTFIFDPETTWDSGSNFERDLADFFGAHGLEAQIVETVGGTGRRVLVISRAEVIAPLTSKKTPPKKEKSFREILNSMEIKPLATKKKGKK